MFGREETYATIHVLPSQHLILMGALAKKSLRVNQCLRVFALKKNVTKNFGSGSQVPDLISQTIIETNYTSVAFL